MKESFIFYKNLLDTMSDQIVVIDKEGNIVYVNKSWLDFASENNLNADIKWQELNYVEVCKSSACLGDKYAKKVLKGITDINTNIKDFFSLEYPCHSEKEQRWFLMTINKFSFDENDYLVIQHKNITHRVLNEQKVKELSMLDSLTSLANRRYFGDFLSREWNRAKRNGKPITLAMIDIDNFKLLNDTYGHQLGDMALKKIARVLKNNLKRSSDLCSRFGGEEFAIIFTEAIYSDVNIVLTNILDDTRKIKLKNIEEEMPHLTVTIGIATAYPQVCNDKEELIKKADLALYKGKDEGKNRVIINRT